MMMTDRARRNLWTLTLSNAVSRFGDHFQLLAVTSLTYGLTGSPLAAALQMAVNKVPWILLARWAGRTADRHDPRRTLALVHLAQAVLTLLYIQFHHVGAILALNLLVSVGGAFAVPARAALLPRLVGRENLLAANARQATVRGAVELLGPVAAGFLLSRVGVDWSFAFNAATFLVPAAAALFLLDPVEPMAVRASDGGGGQAGAEEEVSVWAFLRTRPDLLRLLLATVCFGLGLWGVNALFYPYVVDVLHRGPEVFGWSLSAYFGASLLAGMLMERWGSHLRRPAFLLGGFLACTLIWLSYTVIGSVALMLVLSVLDGVVFTLANILFAARIQEEAPAGSVGRLSATVGACEEAASMAGTLAGGWMGSAWGVLPAMRASSGIAMGLLVVLVSYDGNRCRTGGEPL
ncbi:MAG TPA: MFS transporter [Symbiobacteriaceae bacterium]|nr:MFS transporter [Symbiobacteriaceae bacterium]